MRVSFLDPFLRSKDRCFILWNMWRVPFATPLVHGESPHRVVTQEVMAPDLVEAASELRSKATRSGPWCGWTLSL